MWKMFPRLTRTSTPSPAESPSRSGKRRRTSVLGIERLEDRCCPSRYVLVTDGLNNNVLRYDGTTGAFIDNFVPASVSGMTAPDLGMILDPSGQNFLVDGYGSHNVTRYSLATGAPNPAPGQSGADFVPNGSGGLVGTEGLGFGGPNGDLYVSNDTAPGGNVLEYNGTTGAFVRVLADGGRTRGDADDIHFGPVDHDLYVNALINPGHVFRLDPATGAFLPSPGRGGPNFISPTAGFTNGFAFGPDNNLYVSVDPQDSLSTRGEILRFDGTTGDPDPAPGQTGAIFVASGAGGARFIDGIGFDDAGNIYAANITSGTTGNILKFDGTTGLSLGTLVAAGSGGLGTPGGVLFYNAPAGTASPHHGVSAQGVADSGSVAALASRPLQAISETHTLLGGATPVSSVIPPSTTQQGAVSGSAGSNDSQTSASSVSVTGAAQPADSLGAGDLDPLALNSLGGL
jgi:hypothetical protein